MSVQSIRQQKPVPQLEVPGAALAPDASDAAGDDEGRLPTVEITHDLIEPQWIAAIAAGTD